MEKNSCSNCKHYKIIVCRPVGYDDCENKPDSEGICLKLTNDDNDGRGVIHYSDDDVVVTSNFGCILFER